MEAYSMDLRIRVMADLDHGVKSVEAAKKYQVSTDWIRKLKRFRRDTGSFAPRRQRTSHATKLDAELPRIQALVDKTPGVTLEELREELKATTVVSVSTVRRAVLRVGLTLKKRRSSPRSKNEKTSSNDAPNGL